MDSWLSRSMNHAWKFLSHLDSSSLKALFLKIVSEGPSTGDVMFCNLWLSWHQTNVFCWNFDWKPQSNLPPLVAQCASFSMGKGIFASETLAFRRPSSRRREDRSFVPLPSSPFSLVSPIAASVRPPRPRPSVRPSVRPSAASSSTSWRNADVSGCPSAATPPRAMQPRAARRRTEVVSAEPKLRSEVRGRMMIDGVVVFGL